MPRVSATLATGSVGPWLTGTHAGEHCYLSGDLLAALRLPSGDTPPQIRLWLDPANPYLFTVTPWPLPSPAAGSVGINDDGRKRFGLSGVLPAKVDVDSAVVDAPGGPAGGTTLLEQVGGTAGAGTLLALAPHGGSVEERTDQQAALLQSLVEAAPLPTVPVPRARSWACLGHSASGGSRDRWHITSVDLAVQSFPQLAAVAPTGFRYPVTVSFHGFADHPDGGTLTGMPVYHPPGFPVPPGYQPRRDILLGGHAYVDPADAAGTAQRQQSLTRLQELLQSDLQETPEDDRVVVVPAGLALAGSDPDNLGARLGAIHLQVEQSLAARRGDDGLWGWSAITSAVAARVIQLLAGTLPGPG